MADPAAVALRARALSILREGRLRVQDVMVDQDGCIVFRAKVHGHRGVHQVAWDRMVGWQCDCPDALPCAHVKAAMQVAPTRPPVGGLLADLGGVPDAALTA
jgi:hypothetical protein